MTSRNPGRLAIHRRSDEIAFLQNRLRVLGDVGSPKKDPVAPKLESEEHLIDGDTASAERILELEVLARERDLVDELVHTRQIEPLGETLQRRLAMAERICFDLSARADARRGAGESVLSGTSSVGTASDQGASWDRVSDAYWVAEIERRALNRTLEHWWAWLSES
jgi:hypothetical protein